MSHSTQYLNVSQLRQCEGKSLSCAKKVAFKEKWRREKISTDEEKSLHIECFLPMLTNL